VQLDVIDILRCPASHAESFLVATIDDAVDGTIRSGRLGCPICDARYEINAGALLMDAEAPPAGSLEPADDGAVTKVAALLDLADPGGTILLSGGACALARPLSALMDIGIIMLNPPAKIEGWGRATPLYTSKLALASGTLRGAWVDESSARAIADVVTATRAGGRIVAPATLPVPRLVRELVRDDAVWVGVRQADGGTPVTLRRAASPRT